MKMKSKKFLKNDFKKILFRKNVSKYILNVYLKYPRLMPISAPRFLPYPLRYVHPFRSVSATAFDPQPITDKSTNQSGN
jgi:hypothetical protein